MSKLIMAEFDGAPMQFREDGWFNATAAADKHGKRVNDWASLPSTSSYIEALARNLNTGKSGIYSASDFIETKRGRHGGTWLHPKLAVSFARWISDDFAVWCDLQIDAVLRGESGYVNARRLRHDAAITYRIMSDVLHDARSADGKDTAAHHYMNEAKLIGYAMTGESAGLDRDGLSCADLDLLAAVEKRNTFLIARGIPYADRKIMLRTFATMQPVLLGPRA